MLAAESSTSEDEETGEEDADKKPKTKTVKETTYEWEVLNDVKAIWLRSPKEVTDEEYTKFYHSIAKVTFLYPYLWTITGLENLQSFYKEVYIYFFESFK